MITENKNMIKAVCFDSVKSVLTDIGFDSTYIDVAKTKYLFNDKILGKGRLVFEVVKRFTEENQHLTFEEIQKKFPANLQGSTGVVNTLDFVNQKYQGSKKKRHFIDNNDTLISGDGIKFLVSTEWGIGNINKFVELARNENYDIQEK